MEIVALFNLIIFSIALGFVILTLVIFIKSLARLLHDSQDKIPLWLSIVTAISSLSIIFIFSDFGVMNYFGVLTILIAFSLIFIRKYNTTVFLFSFSQLILLACTLPYRSIFDTSSIEIFRAVSVFSFSAYEISYISSVLVLVIIGLLAALTKIFVGKKTIAWAILGVFLLIGLGIFYDLYTYKNNLASSGKYNLQISKDTEIIPFNRNNELWLVNSDRSNERKIAPSSGKILNAIISPDKKYLSYATTTGEYTGQLNETMNVYIVNLQSGEDKQLQLPTNSMLRGIDFSTNNMLFLATTIPSLDESISYPFKESMDASENYIFDPNGRLIEKFEGFYNGNKWIGNDLYLINRVDEMDMNSTLIVRKAINAEPTTITNSPISMGYGSDEIKYDNKNKTILFLSHEEQVATIFNIRSQQFKKLSLKHAKNQYTINLSPDGKYFTCSSIRTLKINFLQSTADTKYGLMIDNDRSGIWLKSNQKMVLESKSGLEILDINGKIMNLTSNPEDKIFNYLLY